MDINHALLINFHQPAGNLERQLVANPWQAKETLYALDRMPRALWDLADLARVHLILSGTLLETLSSPGFQERVYGIVKLGDLLWFLQNRQLFEVLGTAYYHPLLPLVPEADWDDQLGRWLGIGRHLLWRDQLPGVWTPEMGFCMELIPHIKRLGYSYVVVDSEHVEALEPMRWDELRYRPHLAEYAGEEIVVVVRDRDLSNAQESGMSTAWFEKELEHRTRHCDFPPLVTTACDGDAGGWFLNVKENFWTAFYRPLLERKRRGQNRIAPIHIHEYLRRHGAQGRVTVRRAARNTGWNSGTDFLQWAGSEAQRQTLARVHEVSAQIHAARETQHDPVLLEQARWRLLRSETSCNYFWGDSWLHKAHRDLDDSLEWLRKAQR